METQYVTQIFGYVGLFATLLYFHRDNVLDRRASDDRWATLKSETDARFSRMDERWLEVQKEILKINQRLDAADLTRRS